MAKKTYLARTPIDHDGERYEIGEPIELEDKQAAPLVASRNPCGSGPKCRDCCSTT